MELTEFLEGLLGIKLKPYQKLAIENFQSENVKPKKKYKIVNSFSEFQDDGYLGSMETYYRVRNNENSSEFVVHESDIGKYNY